MADRSGSVGQRPPQSSILEPSVSSTTMGGGGGRPPPPSVDQVKQCTRCGAITMLSRCPRCNAPAVSPSEGGGGATTVTGPPRSSSTGPGQGLLKSPAAPTSRPLDAPPDVRSKSGGGLRVSPARVAPMPTQQGRHSTPTRGGGAVGYDQRDSYEVAAANGTTPGGLRIEVDRLQSELRLKTAELQNLRHEAQTSAHSKHEVDELWRTIRRQNEDLEKSQLLEAELRAFQQKYDTLATERDGWQRDALSRQEVATSAITQSANEVVSVREEMRSLNQRLAETQSELEAKRRQAADAEAALDQRKAQVQRTTAEVKELQVQLVASRSDDQQLVLEAQQNAAKYQTDARSFELRCESLEAAHSNCKMMQEADFAKIRSLQEQLALSEAESKATQEEVGQLRARLAEQTEDAGRCHLAEDKNTRLLQQEAITLRDTVDSLQAKHKMLALELAEANGKLEYDRVGSQHKAEAKSKLQEEAAVWKGKAEAAEERRAHLGKQVEDLRLEVLQLNNEAETTSSMMHMHSSDATSKTAEQEHRIVELKAQLRAAQNEATAKGDDLHKTTQSITTLQLETNKRLADADERRHEMEKTHLAREQEVRRQHDSEVRDLQRQIDEQNDKMIRLDAIVESKEVQHGKVNSDLKQEIAAMQSRCDAMRFECERLQAHSPRRVQREIETANLNTKAVEQKLEAAERRIEEHKTLLNSVKSEVVTSRQELTETKERVASLQATQAVLMDVLRADSETEIVPAVSRLVTQQEQMQGELKFAQGETERRVVEVSTDLVRLQTERSEFKAEAEKQILAWRQLSQQFERQKGLHDKEVEALRFDLESKRDELSHEVQTLKLDHQRSSDELQRGVDTQTLRAKEFEAALQRAQVERDNLYRSHTDCLKELDQLQKAHRELGQRFGEAQDELAASNKVMTDAEIKTKEMARSYARLEQDKDRVLADCSSVKASCEAELVEIRQRLSDQKSASTREFESLRATVRVEREKVLREVENVHSAELKVNELEMTIDSLKAERERLTKELDLSKRAQASKSESYHHLVDEAAKERDTTRKDLEDLRQKHSAQLKEHEVTLRDKRRLEEESDQHLRQRDMALRQLDSAKLERDVAMKSAMDFKQNASGVGGNLPSSRSASGGGAPQQQHYQQPLGGGGSLVMSGSGVTYSSAPVGGFTGVSTVSPPRHQNVSGYHRDPAANNSGSSSLVEPARPRGPERSTGGVGFSGSVGHTFVPDGASTPPPPVQSVPHSLSSFSGAQQTPSTIGSAPQYDSQPQSAGPSHRSASAKERNDALFAHFREQQHQAGGQPGTPASSTMGPSASQHPGTPVPALSGGIQSAPAQHPGAPPPQSGSSNPGTPRTTTGADGVPLGSYRPRSGN